VSWLVGGNGWMGTPSQEKHTYQPSASWVTVTFTQFRGVKKETDGILNSKGEVYHAAPPTKLYPRI
jgi:hypothetical protein